MCIDRNKVCLRLSLMMFAFLLIGVSGAVEGFAQVSRQAETQEDENKGEGVERAFMGGMEIQGTIEKPHVVYIVPWKESGKPSKGEIVFDRSFRDEILEPLEYGRFQRQWGKQFRKGGK